MDDQLQNACNCDKMYDEIVVPTQNIWSFNTQAKKVNPWDLISNANGFQILSLNFYQTANSLTLFQLP